MRPRLAPLVVAALLVATACTSSPPGGDSIAGIGIAKANVARAAADPADATLAAAALNAFGVDLFRAVGSNGGNVVLSPASVAIALSMARAGAKGATADEMDRLLRNVGADSHAGWLNALDRALTSRTGTFKDASAKDVAVSLRIANAPFAQRDTKWQPGYLDALAGRFGAGLRLVDYRADPEAARKLINRWVAAETAQRIPELLAEGTIDILTRLALVNAIYLKAPWQTPFDTAQTKDGPFERSDGTTAQVPFMAASIEAPYAEGAGWRAVELPYAGGSLAMTVIVPDDMAAFERALDGAGLAAIVAALQAASVNLALPKFGLETQTDLADPLIALGMPTAFDRDKADFSGMTLDEQLYIAAVIHQANIDVDEKGTEAAAATAVILRASSAPAKVVTLRADRPFLFLLRDVPTGAVLFMGRVADPSIRG